MRRAVILLVVGACIGAAGAGTHAGFSSPASNPNNSITADPDWMAPQITAARLSKTEGGVPNFVKPSGTYRVCATIDTSDPGNPASGVAANGRRVNLSPLGNSATQSLTTPLSAPCGGADTYGTAQLTAGGVSAGGQTLTVTTLDNDGQSETHDIAVTVDGTAPNVTAAGAGFSGVDKDGVNPGIGVLETGDKAVFAFSEPIDPESIIAGWDGTTRAITARVINNTTATLDRLQIRDGATILPLHRTDTTRYVALASDYVTAQTDIASEMEIVGNTVEVRFTGAVGNLSGSAAGTAATTWHTSNVMFDRAGNLTSVAANVEPAPADVDF